MNPDQGFSWIVLQVPPNEHYKLTDGATYAADPWSRAYTYDDFGEMSLVGPTDAHLDRWFGLGDAANEPRTVRVWVPTEAPTHVLYAHDGQNLFDPEALFGYWKLQETVPPQMLVVGVDNTPARMDEYTHVPDIIQRRRRSAVRVSPTPTSSTAWCARGWRPLTAPRRWSGPWAPRSAV
jgi:hypothetical protein